MQKTAKKEDFLMSHSHCYFANSAFLSDGWANDVMITVNDDGWITDIQPNQKPRDAIHLQGAVLPGMPNIHSHAFQRAMAGLAERVTSEQDSFWTWREIMYQFLQKLTPEDHEAIAAQLYVEMLKAGFTSVGEFHYVHHQSNGTPYAERELISRHIITAALEAGIAITHLPVLYAFGGFGEQKPSEKQKRFINDDTEILSIITTLHKAYRHHPQINLGLAHHSLRAVNATMLQQATKAMHELNPDAPIHIHIAEQIKEVNDCLASLKQRPVEWLLANMDIDHHWCLVHATHMNETETRDAAKSGAIAGICPTTEANLGDGFFNLPEFIGKNGSFALGSDSHVSVSMIEELRLLEYGQRLLRKERNVTKMSGEISIGKSLYQMALQGGAKALGRATGEIAVGKRADFIALDERHPALVLKEKDLIFDAMIFAANSNPIRHVVAGGKHVVRDFRHVKEEEIFSRFRDVLALIMSL